MTALVLGVFLASAHAEPPVAVAGSVVRSKEWVVRRGKVKEEEFKGDVRYESAGTLLTADWALYRHEPNDWKIRGGVDARKEFADGTVISARGENAAYNQTTQAGTLDPAAGARAVLLRTTPLRDPDHGEAEHLAWQGQTLFILSGHAHGWGPRAEFWAETARYDAVPSRALTLTGTRPLLHVHDDGVDAALNAEKIHDVESPRRADAAGHVLGWVITQSTYTRRGDPARCLRDSREGRPGPDARVTALLAPPSSGPRADAKFWEAETAAFTAHACPWETRIDFWADETRYEELPDRRLTLTGSQAVLRKLDDEWSTALKADRFVASGYPRRIVAQGKVKGWLQFKDEKKYERSAK